jgi:hypothetical protein
VLSVWCGLGCVNAKIVVSARIQTPMISLLIRWMAGFLVNVKNLLKDEK